MFENVEKYAKELVQEWEKLDEEDQEFFLKLVGAQIGQIVAYKIYKRMGAPKWAAWGISSLGASLYLSPDRAAYEGRRRLKRKIEAMSDQFKR